MGKTTIYLIPGRVYRAPRVRTLRKSRVPAIYPTVAWAIKLSQLGRSQPQRVRDLHPPHLQRARRLRCPLQRARHVLSWCLHGAFIGFHGACLVLSWAFMLLSWRCMRFHGSLVVLSCAFECFRGVFSWRCMHFHGALMVLPWSPMVLPGRFRGFHGGLRALMEI